MTVKKKTSNIGKTNTLFATEDESAEFAYQEQMRRDAEALINAAKGLTKAQLIKLLSDARPETAVFSGWLLRRNRSKVLFANSTPPITLPISL